MGDGGLNTCPHTCLTPTLAPELLPHLYDLLFLDPESMVEVGHPRRQNRQPLLLSVIMCVCVSLCKILGRSNSELFFYVLFCFEERQNEAIYLYFEYDIREMESSVEEAYISGLYSASLLTAVLSLTWGDTGLHG